MEVDITQLRVYFAITHPLLVVNYMCIFMGAMWPMDS